MDTTVGVLGGTGPMGRGLAVRLAAAGIDVVLGSREEERARGVVADLAEQSADVRRRVRGADNGGATREASIVLMAAPWAPGLSLVESLADELAGRIVVSVANALTRAGDAFLPLTMPRGSVAAEIAARVPAAAVTAAFHHLPAGPLGDLDQTLDADVLVVGDDPAARAVTLDLVDAIDGLRAVDAGGLHAAGAIEALTAVLVGINVGYRTHSAVRLVGDLDGPGPARAGR